MSKNNCSELAKDIKKKVSKKKEVKFNTLFPKFTYINEKGETVVLLENEIL